MSSSDIENHSHVKNQCLANSHDTHKLCFVKSSDNEKDILPMEETVEDPGYGWRHLQLLLMFLAALGLCTHRSCLSVAVVAMTTEEINSNEEVYSWNLKEQGIVLGSFLWGYAATQAPAGYLANRFGAKRLIGAALICSSASLLLIPIVAQHFDWLGVSVLRVFTGLFQGTTFPGLYALIGKWVLPHERSRASALALSAQPSGIVVSMALSGILAVSAGWPAIFYVFGSLTLFIAILWFYYCADNPEIHPRISKKEQNFILRNIGNESQASTGPPPWYDILTSMPFWITVIGNVSCNFGLWMLLTALPRYMHDVFSYNIVVNGVVSSVPYIFMVLTGYLSGWLSDTLIKKNSIPLSINRKLFNTLSTWVPAATLVALTVTPNQYKVLQLVELTIAIGLVGCSYSGCMANYVDLSPRFSGLIVGIGNCIAVLVSAVGPPLTGILIDSLGDTMGWSIVFYITAGLYFFTNLAYILWGTTDLQPWNDSNNLHR